MVRSRPIQELDHDALIHAVKLKVIEITTDEFSDKLVYHNISFINRLIESIDQISIKTGLSISQYTEIKLAGWLCLIGLADIDSFQINNNSGEYLSECSKHSEQRGRKIMADVGIPLSTQNSVIKNIREVLTNQELYSIQAKVLQDAFFSDFTKSLGSKYLNKLYRELMLFGIIKYSKYKWLKNISIFLTNHSYQTDYCQKVYESEKIKLILRLEKKIREHRKINETVIKKEMNISASELKQLTKTLKKVKDRDERGVQTMFRTTSRNHYTLNEMLDRKANILISINTILLSVVITKMIGGDNNVGLEKFPVLIMMITALTSILFAIMAIMPEKTHGEFTESEIRNNKGNLLFFGNYHNMTLRDYTWGMLQMINKGEYLYMSMIRDLYFFGKQLAQKYKMLRLSLISLGLGLSLSTISYIFISVF